MNYSNYRSSGKRKSVSAFYIVLAICLLTIGALTWYTAQSVRKTNHSSVAEPSGMQSGREQNPISSNITSEIVENPVKDEPYTEPSKPVESAPAEEKETKPEVFSVPLQGEIIKGYSDTELQYSATYGDMRLHQGIDISCEEGVSVSAAASGTVTAVEENAELGTVITIDHGNGLLTRYAAIKDAKVKTGAKVSAGDIIGTVGTIPGECADQTHLHFEAFKNDHPADPVTLFESR